MSTTLVIPEQIASRLRDLTQLDVETAAVLLTRSLRTSNGDRRLLGTQLREVPERAYTRREPQGLRITSEGYVPALHEAEQTGAVPIWFHTHPGNGSSPRASEHDRHVDEQLSDLFRL